MNSATVNIVLFITAIVVFGIYAVCTASSVSSPKAFFYRKELSGNIISLTAANITLGTGLAYLIQGGQQNGILMLIIPASVFLGYYLLATFISKYVANDVLEGRNFIHAINEQIYSLTGRKSRFKIVVSISLILIYTLILPFEIFASSKIISPLMFPGGGLYSQIYLSLLIFLATLLYVSIGGIAAVFVTDKLQLSAILLFIGALSIVFFGGSSTEEKAILSYNAVLKFDLPTILSVIAASIASICTQFYSLMNWGYISHLDASERSPMLKFVGFFSALLLLIIVSFGIFYSGNPDNGDAITGLMEFYSSTGVSLGWIFFVISGLSILGMTSIVFSTVDSLMIKLTVFYYDNIVGKNSKNEHGNQLEIKYIRKIIVLWFIPIFIILGYFNFIQPNLFYLLLTVTAGVNAFALMIATAGYLSYKGNALKIFTNRVVMSYLCIFIFIGILCILLFFKKPAYLGWIGTLSFLLASFFSLIIIIKGKQKHSSQFN